jgi:Zn-dependent M28 family amino/carboxypeptidase
MNLRPNRIGMSVLALTASAAMASSACAAPTPPAPAFDGHRAMADIASLLKFTPRSLGTPGHAQAIKFIEAELAKTRIFHVREQTWRYKGQDGAEHTLTNIIASTEPANAHRVLVGTHYDSIVRAYKDPTSPDAPMPGANNSASGVAVLLEEARIMAHSPALHVGVDLVFFDGEEGQHSLGAGDPDWFAVGSPYFVAHLTDVYPHGRPASAVILDMVCYRDSKLKPDQSSLAYDPEGVARFWRIGRRVAPSLFDTGELDYAVDDDQTALAGDAIPSFLVIGIEYEPWFNTTQDTIDKCSTSTLAGVGETVLQFLAEP